MRLNLSPTSGMLVRRIKRFRLKLRHWCRAEVGYYDVVIVGLRGETVEAGMLTLTLLTLQRGNFRLNQIPT